MTSRIPRFALLLLFLPPALAVGQIRGKGSLRSRDGETATRLAQGAATRYCTDINGHGIGRIALSIDNLGALGEFGGPGICYSDSWRSGRSVGTIEYPSGSGHHFASLFLTVGAVRETDTLVSAAGSPWTHSSEFYPTNCDIDELVSPAFKGQFCWDSLVSEFAISDQQLIAYYADTLDDPTVIVHDPIEGRLHRPLGIEVVQKSYGWASGGASNSVIVEYELSNIGVGEDRDVQGGRMPLKGVYVGIYGDIYAYNQANAPFETVTDDILEFIGYHASPFHSNITELFNTVWMADNDGGLPGPNYDRLSIPEVVAISLLRGLSKSAELSFNWWTRDPDPTQNWGPVKRTSRVDFPHGGLGPPLGDRSLCEMMANREIDYPQLETVIDHQGDGWLPPPSDPARALGIADGTAIWFILSVGPIDLPADSTVGFAIAITGAPEFHPNPSNFINFFNPLDPEPFRSRLNVDGLLRNVQWAKWTYDNPGVDTDGDGYAGDWYLRGSDTVYYRGDGIPDLRAALPPPAPILRPYTRAGQVTLHWSGYRSETGVDLFTQRADFEGYRVYMNRSGAQDDWVFLTQRDLPNYQRVTWNELHRKWESLEPPFSLEALKSIYDTLTVREYGYEFYPDSFKVADQAHALLEIHFDPNDPAELDSLYRYFVPYEANNWPDDLALKEAVEQGLDVTGVIRKLYPKALPEDTVYREDGSPFAPYYEYEYILDNLLVAEPVFFSVTAFDHGDPATGTESLESSPSTTAREIWPINSADVVKEERPKPGVYPNPYRISDYYNAAGWENPRGLEPDPERARKITFTNVPDTCTVSIWSIDGDLVRRLEHRADPSSSEATVVVWNLITRNTQAVKTGIYIYSIESRFGTDVGKLVIIK